MVYLMWVSAVAVMAIIYYLAYAVARRKRFHNINFVNVQDVFLVPEELQKHAGEVAKRHIISNKKRSPKLLLWRINDNYRYIRSLYKKLNEEVRLKKSVNPASEWLLDNFYIIEEQIKDVKRILKSGNDLLPVLKEGYLNGYPRVYVLALEMVAHTDGKVDEKVISDFIKAYQSKSLLTTREIWALGYMLRIALIENLRFLCNRINETIRQWRKAEEILDSEDILKAAKEHIKGIEINYSFVEHLLQKLRKRGREAMHIINDLRNLLAEFGVTEEQIAQLEHQYQASMEVTIGNSITSLKLLSSMDWTDIFEELSSVEQILRKDPSGTYSRMDFASRNYYREIVEKIALNAKVSETLVAIKAVECACDVEDDDRKRHVGYYLIDKGKDVLEKKIGFEARGIHKCLKKAKEHVAFIYIGLILAITVLIEVVFLSYTYRNIGKLSNLTAAVIMALVFVTVLIPASEISVSIVNWLVTRIVRPNILPKLELKDGIPDDAATFVVIPALLSDEKRVKELLFNLEKYYLANKGKNVYFALLGDFKDGPDKEMPDDDTIVKCALSGIKELNKRYAKDEKDIFYYFHRERQYNKSQSEWMGWERKRGALLEFNDMLCGSRKTSYYIVSSDIKKLPKIKYVITLDADTQLPIDSAKELIGTIMHPLNKAIVDEKKGIVVDGYGLLQPRIGVDIVSSNRTLFARIFAGQSGIDPYTTAVSDVYQDLFGEGIYTGKGIYDVEVFQRILRDAIPDNSILSHDLLEGSYVRAGLVTDVELIDGYPAKYNSYAMRLHRWVRGDWQLIPWLFSKIKNREGKVVRNPLSVVSKWKIFDNLRRSLVAPSLMVLTVMSFNVFPGNIYMWFGFILLTAAFPAVLEVFDLLLSGQIWVPRGKRFSPVITGFKAALYRVLVLFIFMPYQAYLMSDAIIRTLWRVFFTRKNLMEWVTAADMERKLKNDAFSSFRRMWVAVLEALVIFALDYSFSPFTWQLTLPLLALWSISPYLAYYISLPIEREVKRLSEEDIRELRLIARKTWRYFEDFVGPDDNYLPPDNYQEDPPNGIAHRTSPTNIGLLLISTLSARDFGYLSTLKMIERLDNTISTIEKMDKWNGHLFNWYNTRTLRPLRPRYVSTVDSGNLVAYMITLRQGLLEYMKRPVCGRTYIEGFMDTIELIKSEDGNAVLDTKPLKDALSSDVSIVNFRKLLEGLRSDLEGANVGTDDLVWYQKAKDMVGDFLKELNQLMPWLDSYLKMPQWEGAGFIASIVSEIEKNTSLIGLKNTYSKAIGDLDEYAKDIEDDSVVSWIQDFKNEIVIAEENVDKTIKGIRNLVDRLKRLIDSTQFEPLYVPVRQLFSIGYNVEEGQLSKSYYDLLASEARQTSYIAIARGEIDKKHWFRLGRALTVIEGYKGLVSWTGTMFEYLMPMLTMRSYENTLLDETYYFVIRAQKLYGNQRKVPWGTSESAYYSFDINLNYQYKAFGVPSLGLKRGLANEVVVAPYATMLALPLDPEGVMQNIRILKRHGLDGPYGLYEAIDYTTNRLVQGEKYKVVKSFMVHHQGMSFLALDNYLNDNIMQERFHSDPVISSAEMLLQERLPDGITFKNEEKTHYEPVRVVEQEEVEVIRMPRLNEGPLPDVHLLSNGSYSIMVTDRGTGYSLGEGLSITRWREDPLGDFGMLFYIQNINSNNVWSATYTPYDVLPDKYKVVFSQHKVEFFRTDGNIDTHTEIIVSPSDAAEIRRLSITNHSEHSRTIEVTSYMELVMAPQSADVAHPAFSNLFVKTEYLSEYNSLLANRRPRNSDQSPLWVFHTVTVDGGELVGDVQYETDRSKFIGRGRSLKDPVALDVDHPLSNTTGPVLDPIMSLRRRIKIMPGQTVRIAYTTGMAESRGEALKLAEKYHDSGSIERAFELALTRSRVESRYLNMKASEIQLYQQMIPQILFISPLRRNRYDEIRNNLKGQSALWAHGISGDLPIVLVSIDDTEDIDIVHQLIRAHEYWRVKGLKVDLVILNEDTSSYLQPLNDMIKEAIAISHARELVGRPGGIHLVQANSIDEETKKLFYKVARLVLRGDRPVYDQIALEEQEDLPELAEWEDDTQYDNKSLMMPEVLHFNGTGGFSPDGTEYIIYLKDGQNTPAPWINVISNERFGFQISESGAGYTWAENSRENKLTPWYNDPIIDPPGEVLYLRDEKSGHIWTVTPQPIRDSEPYLIKHGLGYSVFQHISNGIQQELTVFVPKDDPVKICLLKLKNLTGDTRPLSLTYYIRPVLGVTDQVTAPFIVTEVDEDTGILLIRNSYNEDFPDRIAFLDTSETGARSYTGDRREFIGISGGLDSPEALKRKSLSGRVGAGYDPCGALQVKITLNKGEEKIVSFLLGQCRDIEAVRNLCSKYRSIDNAQAEYEAVRKFWNKLTKTIQVKTPDTSMDFMINCWLPYQTIACRIWARSAFYQSGGAYGFRDQLQDVMNIVYIYPELTRQQILISAAHQFKEGDVQHWWHPGSEKGIRTRYSDDLLWLAFATSDYITCTGDTDILKSEISYLIDEPLKEDEDERYNKPLISETRSTLYEHCVKAIDRALRFGPHGIPLIGSGDWNDGMNAIGNKGRGESIWLGWFLYTVLVRFIPLCEMWGDRERAEKYREVARKIVDAIEESGWDGSWYRRAYFDDGTPLGSVQNSECKIDSIAQSWSVISGGGRLNRAKEAMGAVEHYLISKESGLIKLLMPPFDEGDLRPGYIRGYVPGVRENGGQYTHAAVWVVMAFALLGEGDKAWEYYSLINPINHSRTPLEVSVYKVEPYVMAADVYAVQPHEGRGGWTWYTGAAGWMYRVGIEHILGLKIRGSDLMVDPCIPKGWKEYMINYRYKDTQYIINIKNPEGVNRGVKSTFLDGELIEGNIIHMVNDGAQHRIEIYMGN